jgi:DNA-binding NtrC family response regulator
MADEAAESSSVEGKTPAVILIVEDDEAIGDLLVQVLKSETPYLALLATDAAQALERVKAVKPNLFILDYHLPGIDGLELHDRLHAIEGLEEVPTLMISSHSPGRQAMKQRQITFLKKPFELVDVLNSVEALLSTNP